MSADSLFTEYRRRGWALVPIPPQMKGPVRPGWPSREFAVADFPPGGDVGLILGSRSGELVDGDLDASEALALADIYLPSTGAVFGRASKPWSHRLFVAPGAVYESVTAPLDATTLLVLRAEERAGPDGRREAATRPSSPQACIRAPSESSGDAARTIRSRRANGSSATPFVPASSAVCSPKARSAKPRSASPKPWHSQPAGRSPANMSSAEAES